MILTCVLCLLGLCAPVIGNGNSMQKILEDVDQHLDHRPSDDRVPDFMLHVYNMMRDDLDSIVSGYTHQELDTHSPVIKSIRARHNIIRANKFRFTLPRSSKVSEISCAQLMVKSNFSTVQASYRNESVPLSQLALSEDYNVFNVTGAVKSHTFERHPHITFHIDFGGRRRLLEDVFLILLENIVPERLHQARKKRNVQFQQASRSHFLQGRLGDTGGHGDEHACQRREWSLNFQDLGWFWIGHPQTVDVGMCTGSCGILTDNVNITNHAFIRTMYHVQNHDHDASVNPAACAPTGLSPLMVLYFDTNYDTFVRLVPGLAVDNCGCR